MPNCNFVVRRMNGVEVSTAIEWAACEGWNPGLDDAECFYRADPKGFFVGELNGEPIGCISAVAYDNLFGFVGFYIVRPEFRRKGFGLQLWNAAMEYMGNRNVGLDGVVAQQKNYRKSGFRLAYRNIRYSGINIFSSHTAPDNVVKLSSLRIEDIAKYDRLLFPAPRADFLKGWINQPRGQALGVIDNSGNITGYGVIRPCRIGFKIGPLFVDNEQIAETLFLALSKYAAKAPVFLDIPEVNPAAVDLVRYYRMEKVFETARMYTKGEPALPIHRMFGVTTFELG
jgi:ribosomal protein S18 acetylase RimI-like enzyme